MQPTSRRPDRRIIPLLAITALAATARWGPVAWAAPVFAISGRTEELRKTILARDGAAEISAFDVLLYLEMERRGNARVTVEEWLGVAAQPNAKSQEDIRKATEEYIAMRRLAAGSASRPAPEFVVRNLTYPAAIAAFVQTQIIEKKQITITQTDVNRHFIAHPEKYSRDSRAEVRYIFIPVPDMSQGSEILDAQAQLTEIRGRISGGELTFAEAASRFSQAPSAAKGGLIPEFTAGTHFGEFDFQTFNLKNPGDMSPVFVGNDGVYLIQLVSKTPPSQTPMREVEDEIRAELGHNLAAPYYRYLYGSLARASYQQNFTALWPYADLKAPVAILDGTALTRDEVMRVNPRVINAGYVPQTSVIQRETAGWIEGERVLRQLEKQKLGRHPYLEQARRIAGEVLAAREALARSIPWERVSSQEAAMKLLGMGEGAAGGVRQVRVFEITLSPEGAEMENPGTAEVVRNTMRSLGDSIMAGRLPTRPEETEFAQRLLGAATDGGGEEALREQLKELRGAMEQSPWESISIKIRDRGWADAAPGIAEEPVLVELVPGEVSGERPIGDKSVYLLVVAERFDKESPWLTAPLYLQRAAFEHEKQAVLKRLTAEVRKSKVFLR